MLFATRMTPPLVPQSTSTAPRLNVRDTSLQSSYVHNDSHHRTELRMSHHEKYQCFGGRHQSKIRQAVDTPAGLKPAAVRTVLLPLI